MLSSPPGELKRFSGIGHDGLPELLDVLEPEELLLEEPEEDVLPEDEELPEEDVLPEEEVFKTQFAKVGS